MDMERVLTRMGKSIVVIMWLVLSHFNLMLKNENLKHFN